jgi:hypothetical protein
MTEDHLNYGTPKEYDVRPAPYPRATLDARSERMWSILAHLSIFLNIFTGFLGPVVAFVGTKLPHNISLRDSHYPPVKA